MIAVEDEDLEAMILDFIQAGNQSNKPRQDSLRTEITQYAEVAQLPDKVTMQVKRNGLTFVLPMRFLHLTTDPDGSQSDQGFKTISPTLSGEPLDLCWSDDGLKLFLLFPDSLVEISPPGAPVTHLFPLELMRSKKPRFANGLLSKRLVKMRRLFLCTSSLKEALVFDLNNHSFHAMLPTDLKDPDTKADWYLPESKSAFLSLDGKIPLQRFLALRWMSDRRAAVLDEGGSLLLVRDGRTLWSSERVWGKRLFRIGSNLVAVCNDVDRSFVLFEQAGDRLEFAGQSPAFPGKVLAIAALDEKKGSSLAVAVGDEGLSRIYRIEHGELKWHPENQFSTPRFPGMPTRITILNSQRLKGAQGTTSERAMPRLVLAGDTPVITTHGIQTKDWLTSLKSDSSFLRWEITLKRPVFLSDGSELTTTSVVNAWKENWQDCFKRECPGRWLWLVIAGAPEFVNGQAEAISGLEILDDFRLRIRLTEPRPLFMEHLAQDCFAFSLQYRSGRPVTSAFTAVESASGRTQLIPNAHFRHGQPALSRLNLANASQDEIISTFQDSLLITLLRERQLVDYFRKLPGRQVEPFPTPSVYFMVFNTFRAPFSDLDLRRYIAGNLARPDELQQIVTTGVCSARDTLFTASTDEFAPPEAITPDRKVPVEIVFRVEDAIARQIAERLTARLRQAGMPVSAVRGLTETEWKRRLKGGDYSLLVASFEPIYNSPIYNLADLIYQGYNVDADILLRLTEGLQGDRQAAKEIENSLVQNVVLRPLLEARNYLVYPDKMMDIGLSGVATLDLSRAWLAVEPEH